MSNQITEDETSETITRQQIIDLREAFRAAGDYRWSDICGLALIGYVPAIRDCETAWARINGPVQ